MKSVKKTEEKKYPAIKINKSLDHQYKGVVFTPDKLEKAKKMLRETGMPEEYYKANPKDKKKTA